MDDLLIQTTWLIPLYGLLGAVLTLPWSVGLVRRTGQRPAAYINLLMSLLAFIHSSIGFHAIWSHAPQKLSWMWLQAADLNLSLAVEMSPVSMGALEAVTGIALLAQLYALGYLEKDWSLARFYGLMGFFEAALSGIAISDSLFLSYALLEMLTLSTYLLVGFWYAQPLVVTAARDAFLTKRIGDVILLMGIVALSSYGAGLSFSELQDWVETAPLPLGTATWVGLALIAGPLGKCAQFPLNLWLDEAMEGPNPAGIVRNSIVVSAGAYVLIELQPVFILSPIAEDVLIAVGAITTVGASLMAIAQIDIKRTLSHSTSAYLGLVFVAVGLGHVDIAFLLLFSHAVAKALLFSSIGGVILNTSNQNVTEMGGLYSKMPATTTAFIVGSLGLVGLFPLGMFWTFADWFNGSRSVSPGLLALVVFANGFSAFNLMRVFRTVFLGTPQPKTRRSPEVAWPMAVPMVSLILATLLASLIPHYWPYWLSPNAPVELDNWVVRSAVPAIVVSGAIGTIAGIRLQVRRAWARSVRVSVRFVQDLLAYDFYIDRIYDFTIVAAVAAVSRLAVWLDRFVVDGVVNLVGLAAVFSGQALRYNMSGQSQFYVLTIALGTGVFVIWFLIFGRFP